MANLYSGRIDTDNDYKELGALTGVTIAADQVYLVQVTGAATFCVATTKPTEGGFTLFNNQVARFKLEAGEQMWVKVYDDREHLLNLAM